MDINEMTRGEFDSLPHRKWDEDIGEFDALIIIPMPIRWYQILKYLLIEWMKSKFEQFDSYYLPDGLHGSGFRCMDFVACQGNRPLCRLSGCSDVIHINGIGGYGKNWMQKYGSVPEQVPVIAWSIDCLRTSGYLRLFSEEKLQAGNALSSFELYATKKQEA